MVGSPTPGGVSDGLLVASGPGLGAGGEGQSGSFNGLSVGACSGCRVSVGVNRELPGSAEAPMVR